MIDFQNPTVVTIKLESDVADFLVSDLGWHDEVTLRFLPQYPKDANEVVEDIRSILKRMQAVPYDNLAVMEEDAATVNTWLVEAIDGIQIREDGSYFNERHVTTGGNPSRLYGRLRITVTERVDNATVTAILAERD